MPIIVTAASGKLGRLVVEALLARGAAPSSVIATARDASKLGDLAERGVATAALDYTKPDTIEAAVGAGDTVILISSDAVGQRIDQHRAVIDAAKAAGAARVVYTSAPKATTSDLILAPEHKATEEYLTASGIPFTILRNGWYTENYAGEVAKARESGEITSSTGDGRVASASRSDYAEAAAAAALDESTAGKTYELSGDHAWDWDELAAAISEIAGTPVTYRRLSPPSTPRSSRASASTRAPSASWSGSTGTSATDSSARPPASSASSSGTPRCRWSRGCGRRSSARAAQDQAAGDRARLILPGRDPARS